MEEPPPNCPVFPRAAENKNETNAWKQLHVPHPSRIPASRYSTFTKVPFGISPSPWNTILAVSPRSAFCTGKPWNLGVELNGKPAPFSVNGLRVETTRFKRETTGSKVTFLLRETASDTRQKGLEPNQHSSKYLKIKTAAFKGEGQFFSIRVPKAGDPVRGTEEFPCCKDRMFFFPARCVCFLAGGVTVDPRVQHP